MQQWRGSQFHRVRHEFDSPALPSGTKFGISGGVGVFAGKSALAMAVTAAVSEVTSVSAGFGLGTDSGEFAGRAGFQFAW